jgi:hypothetical protein
MHTISVVAPKAQEAEQRGVLLRERAFDDVLVREGVVTHYLPLGPEGEKGIDVWLALEAYELAIYKRFDVSVLVAVMAIFYHWSANSIRSGRA